MRNITLVGTVSRVTDGKAYIDIDHDGTPEFVVTLDKPYLANTFVPDARIEINITSSYIPLPNPNL